MRIVRTTLAGWKRYKNHPDARVRRRFAWEARELATTFSAAMAAGQAVLPPATRRCGRRWRPCSSELNEEFGWKSRLMSAVGGPYVYWKLRREEKRLAAGWTYEPPTFYETNFLPAVGNPAVRTRSVSCRVVASPHVSLPILETSSEEAREESAAAAY